MIAIELTMIIVGVIFLLGSFFISDKLSNKDMEQIAKLSENEINIVMEKQLKQAQSRIVDYVDEVVDESAAVTKRALEKTTNEKIMAISEYSDTVLESVNKSHNEIMFLYSMLNDKHTELTNLAGQLSSFSDEMKQTEDELLERLTESAGAVAEHLDANAQQEEPAIEELFAESVAQKESEGENHNQMILDLHKEGKTDVEIAKKLGLGLGEVKLVIGLYKEEAQ